MKNAGVDLPEGYGGDPIQKSHYIQSFLKNSYPNVDDIERGTYAWRLPDLLSDLKKSVVQKNETQTDEEPLSISKYNLYLGSVENATCYTGLSASVCVEYRQC